MGGGVEIQKCTSKKPLTTDLEFFNISCLVSAECLKIRR